MSDLDLEARFLEELRRDGGPAVVITTNGFQLRGRLAGHCPEALLVTEGRKRMLVYKTAVSTVVREG